MNNQTTLTDKEIYMLYSAMNDYLTTNHDVLVDSHTDVEALQHINNKLIATTINGITNAEASKLAAMPGWYTISNLKFVNNQQSNNDGADHVQYFIDADYDVDAIKDIAARSVMVIDLEPTYTIDEAIIDDGKSVSELDVNDFKYNYSLGERAREHNGCDIKQIAHFNYKDTIKVYVSKSWIDFYAGYTLEMIIDEMIYRQLPITFVHNDIH